jgi:D-psicose/D-tagatose/L-ribulose 3-epimerase
MRFGVCCGPADVGAVETAGFDYVEWGLAGDLKPLEDDAEVLPALESILAAASVRVEALNGMVPAQVPIVGPEIDSALVSRYLTRGAQRAAWIGAEVVVFGSAGARNIPDGFSRRLAEDQIAAFLTQAGDLFGAQGITIAIEPLNTSESNILNSVAEAAAMAARVAHPQVCVLSDLYHVLKEGQDFTETADAGSRLAHVHVARLEGRKAPQSADQGLLTDYFSALRRAGYSRRVSIEGAWQETPSQASEGLKVMRTAWEQSGNRQA